MIWRNGTSRAKNASLAASADFVATSAAVDAIAAGAATAVSATVDTAPCTPEATCCAILLAALRSLAMLVVVSGVAGRGGARSAFWWKLPIFKGIPRPPKASVAPRPHDAAFLRKPLSLRFGLTR